jgi:hypothetical protein
VFIGNSTWKGNILTNEATHNIITSFFNLML